MNILEARRRTLGKGVYKKTVEGNPAIAQGSLARRYPGITMQGWTEQDSTTGVQLFNSDSVVDGIISNGTVVENNNFVTSDFIPVTSGNVYSRSGTGASGNFFYDSDKSYLQNVPGTINIEAPEGAAYLRFCVQKTNFDLQSIMFNEGSTLKPWEPYTGGKTSPSPEYPQPITSAGKYNKDTQKWEYEITIANEQTDPDKNQTVTLTADRPLTKWDRLEKRNGQWGWVYGSDEYIAPKTGYQMLNRLESATGVYFLYTIWDDIGIEIGVVWQNQFCNYFKRENPYTFKGNAFWIVKVNEIDKPVLRIGLSDENIDTVEEFEQFLSALDDIKILYKKANTEFVPLSSEEQEAMNSLYTFRPTTVLSNDCECEMTLTYKTKKNLEVTT